MNKGATLAALSLIVILMGTMAVDAQATKGYAAYGVTLKTPQGVHSVVINETVTPTSKAGFQDVILQFIAGSQNLTYSRVVNSTADLFPFLPAVANQTFSYSNGTAYSLSVHVTTSGTTPVTFGGNQYTLNVLKVTASGSYGNRSATANGTVETFPSTLLYSAIVGNSTVNISATLQSTDLPLSGPASQMAAAVYVGAGAGTVAAAVGGAFLLRRRDRKAAKTAEKPMHWVD